MNSRAAGTSPASLASTAAGAGAAAAWAGETTKALTSGGGRTISKKARLTTRLSIAIVAKVRELKQRHLAESLHPALPMMTGAFFALCAGSGPRDDRMGPGPGGKGPPSLGPQRSWPGGGRGSGFDQPVSASRTCHHTFPLHASSPQLHPFLSLDP